MNRNCRVVITRNSSCGTLELPSTLACQYCEPSIVHSVGIGKSPRQIKKCQRPFSDKWANCLESNQVKKYNAIHQYLTTSKNASDNSILEDSTYELSDDESVILDSNVTVESEVATYEPTTTVTSDSEPKPQHIHQELSMTTTMIHCTTKAGQSILYRKEPATRSISIF